MPRSANDPRPPVDFWAVIFAGFDDANDPWPPVDFRAVIFAGFDEPPVDRFGFVMGD